MSILSIVGNILVGLIALLHVYILVLEMFLWTKPLGLKAFRQSAEQAKASATLAANQGLYNGFLAAGLFWGLFEVDLMTAIKVKIFFLICVAVAGVYGGYSVSRRILMIQTVPAALALVCLGLPFVAFL